MKAKPWIALVFLAAAALMGGCDSSANTLPLASLGDISKMVKNPSGLMFQILQPSNGRIALAGDTIAVTYTGTLVDGTIFDSNAGKAPFIFPLGAGKVISGWDEGVAGMRVGETRKLIIPANLGYGSANLTNIPANSTLIFVVQLLEVQ